MNCPPSLTPVLILYISIQRFNVFNINQAEGPATHRIYTCKRKPWGNWLHLFVFFSTVPYQNFLDLSASEDTFWSTFSTVGSKICSKRLLIGCICSAFLYCERTKLQNICTITNFILLSILSCQRSICAPKKPLGLL